ncbi:MAG: glycosyltransferase family 4 protein [Crocinitomicaceae bacterium]
MVKSLIKKTVLYRPLAILYDWYHFNINYIQEVIRILFISPTTQTFFFFPFFHTGGAELVHLNIVKSMQYQTVTFFTLPSANVHFLSEFQQHSDCHNIEKMIRSAWRKKIILLCIAFKINRNKFTSVFGCHSLFFYELLPNLKKEIKCVDLIHAFTHRDEPGFEKFSLPYINRLNQRVTISQKGKNDIIEQYRGLNIPIDLSNQIHVIYNSTNFTCSEIPIKPTDVFNVVYVGRNSPEKRISLIGKIASELKNNNEMFNITLVGGDLEQGVNLEDRKSCNFVGNITSLKDLEMIYRTAHVVLITSTREGIPMALLEGMVFGAVPVSTNVGGISELIEQKKSGILISCESDYSRQKKQFTEEIIQLKNDKSLFQLYSNNSFKRANQNFTKKQFDKNYNEIIQS